MKDARDSSPTPWSKATAAIMTAANVQQTALAQQIGEQKAYVNRFLTGRRRPLSAVVRRINRAVARLAGYPPVEDYLNFEAAASGLLQEERFGSEALDKGVTQCLRWYSRFFKPGAIERIHEIINALDESEKRTCILALNAALRRIIVSELLPPSRPAGFQAVYDALLASGIDLEDVVSERCAAQLAFERFEWIVNHELAAANPRTPASERLAAKDRIVGAVTDLVLAAVTVSSDGAAKGLLREVKTVENGKQVSRFDGDPRAAWTPFMPSAQVKITKLNTSPSRQKRGHS
jgi:transcriptional regulator with XRE-family HTH domain